MGNMTWGAEYWKWWLVAFLGTLFGPEIFALVTERHLHVDNTFSNWVRTALRIRVGEGIGQWNAADLLVFCAYISIFVAWLPWHFWFRKFG